MKRTNVRIAVQRDGRLRVDSIKELNALGLRTPENGRSLIVPCIDENVEILYARHSDLPQYVQSGAADFAIVGDNTLRENEFKVKVQADLGFGYCELVIAVPQSSEANSVQDLEGESIATSYPNSLRQFLREKRVNAAVIKINGSVEVAPALGVADAVCDLTETGRTIKENGLRVIETIFKSEAKLIESPFENVAKQEFKQKFLPKLV